MEARQDIGKENLAAAAAKIDQARAVYEAMADERQKAKKTPANPGKIASLGTLVHSRSRNWQTVYDHADWAITNYESVLSEEQRLELTLRRAVASSHLATCPETEAAPLRLPPSSELAAARADFLEVSLKKGAAAHAPRVGLHTVGFLAGQATAMAALADAENHDRPRGLARLRAMRA